MNNEFISFLLGNQNSDSSFDKNVLLKKLPIFYQYYTGRHIEDKAESLEQFNVGENPKDLSDSEFIYEPFYKKISNF